MAILCAGGCNLASGLAEFEVAAGGHTSTSGGGSGGAAGAGGIGGTSASSGTAGTGGGGPFSVVVPVSQASGDAEECLADGTMALDSPTLELGQEQGGWGPQIVGLRFEHLPMPYGSTILSARVDFVVEVAASNAASATLHGVASDDVFPFMPNANDLSARLRTIASVSWDDIPPWDSPGGTRSSPDLSPIIQEIVDRSGWDADGALALVIEGTGRRSAVAFDASPADAPTLHVEYSLP